MDRHRAVERRLTRGPAESGIDHVTEIPLARRAAPRALITAGSKRAMSMPMIVITTSSSTSVKPLRSPAGTVKSLLHLSREFKATSRKVTTRKGSLADATRCYCCCNTSQLFITLHECRIFCATTWYTHGP